MAPKIQLLTFPACPLAEPARACLKAAMAETGVTTYEEVDILDPSAPAEIIGWGSPTVLINGQDVGGGRKGDSPSCRVYSSPSDVPTVAAIVSAIKRRAS